MKQQMKEDPNKIYWLTDEDAEPFKTILPDQTFYITEDHKLVISFDEYEVAPAIWALQSLQFQPASFQTC